MWFVFQWKAGMESNQMKTYQWFVCLHVETQSVPDSICAWQALKQTLAAVERQDTKLAAIEAEGACPSSEGQGSGQHEFADDEWDDTAWRILSFVPWGQRHSEILDSIKGLICAIPGLGMPHPRNGKRFNICYNQYNHDSDCPCGIQPCCLVDSGVQLSAVCQQQEHHLDTNHTNAVLLCYVQYLQVSSVWSVWLLVHS